LPWLCLLLKLFCVAVRLLGTLTAAGSDLTDAQYCEYLAAEEGKVDHRQQVVELLQEAQGELAETWGSVAQAQAAAVGVAAMGANAVQAAAACQAWCPQPPVACENMVCELVHAA